LAVGRFLQQLSSVAQHAFADLVRAGCQPGGLAFQFHGATQADQYEKDHERLRIDLDELDRLGNVRTK
jgi:hypothetical protein